MSDEALERHREAALNVYHTVRETRSFVPITAALAREHATTRRETIEECAAVVEAMKGGYTCDVLGGLPVEDEDGPWFLKSQCAAAILALLAAEDGEGK